MNDVDHTWRPARFLVIAAHPDDADFGPAGTAARWIDAGSEGWLVCCTSGDAGGEDPDADPLELAALREREQRAAADLIGYAGITFLHQPDGALVNDLVLREQLVREIRTWKPDAVLATDPDGRLLPRRRDQPHGPPRSRPGRGRRGLPGRAQPDGLPGAREGRAGGASGPTPVPVLAERAERPRRHHDLGGPQDRGPGRAREPDPRAGEAGRADPDLGRRGGRGDRVAGGRGPPPGRDRRGRGRRPGSGSRGATGTETPAGDPEPAAVEA